MKQRLLQLMDEAAELLVACGWSDRAEWFRGVESRLRIEAPESREFKEELTSLRGILGGMGSFSDLPLVPLPGMALTEEEAKVRQWDLVEDLEEAIQALLD